MIYISQYQTIRKSVSTCKFPPDSPSPTGHPKDKWLIFSHLFYFIHFEIKILLHFCYIFKFGCFVE